MVTESHQLLAKSIDARDAERQAWAVERQQLLDRIQAPSFGEYKQAEVRTIKAQNGVKEPPPLEQL
ncbi:hypothetical protein [Cohnella panacarvi]|uniref:hypothetical protein n=1 Tax=Cohnella panacarvi TaxID=400776 RepID=UPI0004AE8273|nr:hypothetical protein [Cohnella panacarvi]